jgi:hypothetical protein
VLSVAVGAADAMQLAGIIALGDPPRPEGGRAVLGSDVRRDDIVAIDNCIWGPVFAGRLRKRGRHFATCRSTRPTSIRSSCRRANSRHSCRKVAARTVVGLNRAIRSFI